MKEYNFAFILPNILFLYYKHITLTISDRNAFWQTVHPPSFSLWSIRKAISFSFDIVLISQVYDICDGIVSISHVYDICDGFTTRGRVCVKRVLKRVSYSHFPAQILTKSHRPTSQILLSQCLPC